MILGKSGQFDMGSGQISNEAFFPMKQGSEWVYNTIHKEDKEILRDEGRDGKAPGKKTMPPA